MKSKLVLACVTTILACSASWAASGCSSDSSSTGTTNDGGSEGGGNVDSGGGADGGGTDSAVDGAPDGAVTGAFVEIKYVLAHAPAADLPDPDTPGTVGSALSVDGHVDARSRRRRQARPLRPATVASSASPRHDSGPSSSHRPVHAASLSTGAEVENCPANMYSSITPVEAAMFQVVPPPVEAALAPWSVYVSSSAPESLVARIAVADTLDVFTANAPKL